MPSSRSPLERRAVDSAPRDRDAAADPSAVERGLSRAEQAYRHIVESIKDGSLLPGTRMREMELAERMGLSRTPVREALNRLLSEGLVANDPARGMIVTELDHTMISELYAMREVLEGTAARLAARHASEVEIAFLRDINERDALLVEPGALAHNNRLFHETLYRCAHNRYLVNTLQGMQASMLLLGPTTLAARGRHEQARHEHGEIVTAMETRDGDAAEAHARAHIRQAYKARLESMLQRRQS